MFLMNEGCHMESLVEDIEKEPKEKAIISYAGADRSKICGRFFVAKIFDKSGATMIIAVVIFLISALMSMIIVNSALNNILRLRRQNEERQAMLALTSAASVVEGLFHGCTAYPTSEEGSAEISFEVDFGNSGMKDYEELGRAFQDLVNKPVSGESQEQEVPWTMTVSGADNKALDVNLKLKMDIYHNLTVEIEKPGENNTETYSKSLYFPALEVKSGIDDTGSESTGQDTKVIEW